MGFLDEFQRGGVFYPQVTDEIVISKLAVLGSSDR